MATATAISPTIANANSKTLTDAMAAASISSSPLSSAPDDLKDEEDDEVGELNGGIRMNGDGSDDLEEGEIREEEEEDDGKEKTVFDDAEKFNLKHPLYATWTLYFDSPQSKLLPKTPSSTPATPSAAQGGWMEDIRKVVSFDSVEEFWGLYNNIVPPSQLPGKANYYLFKNGIMPAWEDPKNKNGGKWAIQVPRDKSKGAIDKMWLHTMLAAIGETFEVPEGEKPGPVTEQRDLVTGVIVSSRPNFYRIAIWTNQAPEVAAEPTDPVMASTLCVGKHFKTTVLGYEADQKLTTGGFQTEIVFDSHKDSEKKGSKNKITV